jgi:hypothetical protein
MSNNSVLVIFIFILVVQGNLQRDAQSQRKKEKKKKRALLQGYEKLVGTRKIRLAMVCERKSWEECQSFEKEKKVW